MAEAPSLRPVPLLRPLPRLDQRAGGRPPGRGDRVGSDADKVALAVRLSLPATCPDGGADVLAPPGRPAFNAIRIHEGAAMTLRFIVAVRNRVPVREEAPA